MMHVSLPVDRVQIRTVATSIIHIYVIFGIVFVVFSLEVVFYEMHHGMREK
jgi:hypothetical protein